MNKSILFLASILLAGCTAAWQWDWVYQPDGGGRETFRGAVGISKITTVNQVDDTDLKAIVVEESGLSVPCSPETARCLEIEFQYEFAPCTHCDPTIPTAWARIEVHGPRGVEAKATLLNSRLREPPAEVARSLAEALAELTQTKR